MSLATAQTTTKPWGFRAYCRDCRLDDRSYSMRSTAQEAADDHNRRVHPEEVQRAADEAGLAWALAGSSGRVPAGAFPLWGSPACEHATTRQRRDGRGVVCLDCGRLRVLA